MKQSSAADTARPQNRDKSISIVLAFNNHFKSPKQVKMEAVQNLAPYQQQEFVKHLEQMQLKDSLT
jgi:hypothetical protein